MKLRRIVGVLLVLAFSAAPAARAQEVTGTILGTVTDNTGAVLPGVVVTITNTATGQSQTDTTDAQGRYRRPQLAIGPYDVKAELQGFKTQLRKEVQLTVGAELVINFGLELGTMEETIVVNGDAPVVQTTSTEVASLVDQRMLQQLPLNARDVQQLATLQPGVQSQRYNSLYGPQITVSGVRPSNNRFLLNGVDSTGTFAYSPVSAGGILMGVEGLQEFKVLTNDYSAQYGVKQGGVINMITKAGTNEYHGTAYGYFRDATFDSKNYFDQGSTPPFNRQQFGGSTGGPIVHGRTFFYANYEQFRQRLSLSNVAIVPDDRARLGFVPATGGGETFIGVSSAIAPYLALIPARNGRTLGGGQAEYFSNPLQSTDENYVTFRIDHRISDHDSFWGVYTGDWSENLSPLANPNFAEHQNYNKGIYSAQNVHTFSNTLVNTTRVGLNRTWYFDRVDPTVSIDKSLYLVPDPYFAPTDVGQFPQVSITGFSGMANVTAPRWYQHTQLNVDSDFNWEHGKHAIKYGGSFSRMHDDGAVANPAGRGDVTFQTLTGFLQGKPRQVNIYLPGSDPNRRWRNSVVGLYGEDSMRLRSNLTLSAGVRWETVIGPNEADGKIVNLRDGAASTSYTVGTPYFIQPRNLFAPRVGYNWDVFGNGKTSIRGGGGIFYNQILPNLYYTQTGANSPFTTQLLIPNPNFPDVLSTPLPTNSLADFAAIDYRPKIPTLYSYHTGVQQDLGHRMAFTATYVGSLARHLSRNGVLNTSDENIPFPQIVNGQYFWAPGGTRPNPNFGRISVMHFDANSEYNSLHLSVNRTIATGLAFAGNYTFSKCTDDISDEFNATSSNAGGRLQYNRDRGTSRGPCAFNNNHSANISTTWDLPGHEAGGVVGAVFGGWRWSTITTLQSGVPFEIFTGFNNSRQNPINSALGDRPNWAPGCDANNAVTGNPDQYFNPQCFVLPPAGFLGNVQSRAMSGPNLAVSDWSFAKVLGLASARRLEIQIQVFNIFNRANFAVPSGTTLWSDANTRVASAGKITRTVTPARQMQFGARFAF